MLRTGSTHSCAPASCVRHHLAGARGVQPGGSLALCIHAGASCAEDQGRLAALRLIEWGWPDDGQASQLALGLAVQVVCNLAQLVAIWSAVKNCKSAAVAGVTSGLGKQISQPYACRRGRCSHTHAGQIWISALRLQGEPRVGVAGAT